MRTSIRAQLLALGTDLTPPLLQGTTRLLADFAMPKDPTVAITRDAQYGPDARHRLDIFRHGSPVNAPVVVYVHGGGFVMGDKTSPGSPFYDNIGQWAALQGFIGVTVTYRLAPQDRWPSGPEDMARAVAWLQANIGAHGGDPAAIYLIGQSAGASHVAAYIAHPRFHAREAVDIAGAVMISGSYDATTFPRTDGSMAYYGDDPAVLTEGRHIDGLVASPVPQLYSVSEMDPVDYQNQAAQLAQAWHQYRGRHAPMEYLAGHNHLSPGQAIGSADDDLGPRIAAFIAFTRP